MLSWTIISLIVFVYFASMYVNVCVHMRKYVCVYSEH